MKEYKYWRPTGFDTPGLELEDRQDWLVVPVIQTRDSEALERSNFRVVLKDLAQIQYHKDQTLDDENDYEIHRFGHWGPGWFEIILVRPNTPAAKSAEDWEAALSDYPVADEADFSELEHEEANETWEHCYTDQQRLEYIRDHRSQFEFRSFLEMVQCVRGQFFCGYASELLS